VTRSSEFYRAVSGQQLKSDEIQLDLLQKPSD